LCNVLLFSESVDQRSHEPLLVAAVDVIRLTAQKPHIAAMLAVLARSDRHALAQNSHAGAAPRDGCGNAITRPDWSNTAFKVYQAFIKANP
jgi:hypothetical protein